MEGILEMSGKSQGILSPEKSRNPATSTLDFGLLASSSSMMVS